jgi:FkbM family methyltransferase
MNPYIYQNFVNQINKEDINIVLELGAFDGRYTKDIDKYYNPKKIYSIDANPQKIDTIKNNQQELNNVDFTCILLSDINDKVNFYIFQDDGESSSMYEHPAGFVDKLSLDSITLDNFCLLKNITSIDLICADVEGAEAQIFSQQQILHTVKYIISEVKIEPNFKGSNFPGIEDLKKSLSPFGFKMVDFISSPGFPFGDSLWKK